MIDNNFLFLQFHFDDLIKIVYEESLDVKEYFNLQKNHDPKIYNHYLSRKNWQTINLDSYLAKSLIKYKKTGKVTKKLKKYILKEIEKAKLIQVENLSLLEDNKNKAKNGFIYILKSKNLYKIGRTLQFKKRIKIYKTENPFGIKIIFQKEMNNCFNTELELLKKFKNKKYKGEWFKLNKKDIKWIKNNI
jgi:hypothetical protein